MAAVKGCSLIVDTNYILFKNTHALTGTRSLYADLENAMFNSFENFQNLYPFSKIFMVCDSKYSWRKDVYSKYKATRKERREKQDIDWEFVFNTYENFKAKMAKKRNITHLEATGIEGDDWIRYAIEENNKKGYSTVTVSSDNDLNQLLQFSISDDAYINIKWNDQFKNSKVYVPTNYAWFKTSVSKDGGDLFDMNDNDLFIQFLEELEEKNDVVEVDAEESLFLKLVSGDKGDNIDSILNIPLKSNPNKFRGIGDAGAKKIWEEFKTDNPDPIDFTKDYWIDELIYFTTKHKKINEEEFRAEIMNNIRRNRELIMLSEQFMPSKYSRKLKLVKI